MQKEKEIAVLGAGCFWCTEAVFQQLKGVISVEPGYAGGHTVNPTYVQVCSGITGHAEVARIEFDSTVLSYEKLLEVFFAAHDPTSLNKQGNDSGTQYRSVIFFTSAEQQMSAEDTIKKLGPSYAKPIVTQVVPLDVFYAAEDYHKNYYETHADQPYCQLVVAPKVEKIQKQYSELIK